MLYCSLHSPQFSFSLGPLSQRSFLTHLTQLYATHRNYALLSTQLTQLIATHVTHPKKCNPCNLCNSHYDLTQHFSSSNYHIGVYPPSCFKELAGVIEFIATSVSVCAPN